MAHNCSRTYYESTFKKLRRRIRELYITNPNIYNKTGFTSFHFTNPAEEKEHKEKMMNDLISFEEDHYFNFFSLLDILSGVTFHPPLTRKDRQDMDDDIKQNEIDLEYLSNTH